MMMMVRLIMDGAHDNDNAEKDDKCDDNDEPLCGGSSVGESLKRWKLGGLSRPHLNIIVFVFLSHCY